MNRHLRTEPDSDAALFDMMHGLFGLGDFNDSTDGNPWFKHRMREIAKIKAIRKKRHVTLRDFALAARYCFTHQIGVHESYQLCAHIPDARREVRMQAVSSLAQQIANAVAMEQAKPEPNEQVIDRLLRARATGRRVVLDEWWEVNG